MTWAKTRTQNMLDLKYWQSITDEERYAILDFVEWVCEYDSTEILKLSIEAQSRLTVLRDLYLKDDAESTYKRERTEIEMRERWIKGETE